MISQAFEQVRRNWRSELFSDHAWVNDDSRPMDSGESGAVLVKCDSFPYGAYLKPSRKCNDETPRAANEKIVSDLASDLLFDVPPVLLYGREVADTAKEETCCCVSLVMYPEQYEWGLIFSITQLPPMVQQIIRTALAQYSETFAFDLLIGQTDRNNARNVIFGTNPRDPVSNTFLFLDHAYALNHSARWSGDKWRTIEMVPVPDLFKECLSKPLLLRGAEKIEALPDEGIREIVSRIPDEYMKPADRDVVTAGLSGRKRLIRRFIEASF